jgi:hypothetical protein
MEEEAVGSVRNAVGGTKAGRDARREVDSMGWCREEGEDPKEGAWRGNPKGRWLQDEL